jgi:hypothetical protein
MVSYSGYNFQQAVKDRLDKTLYSYMDDLDKVCERLREKDNKVIIKELSK